MSRSCWDGMCGGCPRCGYYDEPDDDEQEQEQEEDLPWWAGEEREHIRDRFIEQHGIEIRECRQ
jgi:hypothetical protein